MPNVLSQKLDFFLKVSTVFSDFQLENRELACVAGGGGAEEGTSSYSQFVYASDQGIYTH